MLLYNEKMESHFFESIMCCFRGHYPKFEMKDFEKERDITTHTIVGNSRKLFYKLRDLDAFIEISDLRNPNIYSELSKGRMSEERDKALFKNEDIITNRFMLDNLTLLSTLLTSDIPCPIHPIEGFTGLYYKSYKDMDKPMNYADLIGIFSNALKNGVSPEDVYSGTKKTLSNINCEALAVTLAIAMYRVGMSFPKIFSGLTPIVHKVSLPAIAVQLARETVSNSGTICDLLETADKYGIAESPLIRSTAICMLDKKYHPEKIVETLYPRNTLKGKESRLKLATWLAAQMEKRGDPTEDLPGFMKKYFEELMGYTLNA